MQHWAWRCWTVFHTSAYQFSESKRDAYIKFYILMGDLLPCPKCARGLRFFLHNWKGLERLRKMKTKDEMVIWVVDLHNYVNNKLNKRQFTYAQANKIWGNKSGGPKIKPQATIEFFWAVVRKYNTKKKVRVAKLMEIIHLVIPIRKQSNPKREIIRKYIENNDLTTRTGKIKIDNKFVKMYMEL